MAGRPAKTLFEHLREGTFRAERHAQLLAEGELPFPGFALLQQRYRAAVGDAGRHQVALEFERAVELAHAEARSQNAGGAAALTAELALLGKPGSQRQLEQFFAQYLVHPKGPSRGQPFLLEGWQKRFLRDLYRRDEQGRRIVQFAVLGIPRGNGKTALAAGIALYELLTRVDAPEILLAACSKKQAAITHEFARGFVGEGPLARWLSFKEWSCRCQATGGEIRVLSSDGRLQFGTAPAVTVLDEFWGFKTKQDIELFDAMVSGLHKRDDSLLLVITTAGHTDDTLLKTLYDEAHDWPEITVSKNGCLTVAKDDDNGLLLYWYGVPDDAEITDTRLWRAANPAGFVDLKALRRTRNSPGFSESEFCRLNLNQWRGTRQSWIPIETWRRLETSERIPDGAAVFVGVDVGISHDTTAIVWAHHTPAGRILLGCHVFGPSDGADAHSHFDGQVRLERIEQFISDDLGRRFLIKQIAYDPRFFGRSAELLERNGTPVVAYFPHSAPTYDAYQRFYQLVVEGTVGHDGDPILAAHITNTAAYKTNHGWKLSKLANEKWIDATVAACFAVARADLDAHVPEPGIFWLDPYA